MALKLHLVGPGKIEREAEVHVNSRIVPIENVS